MSSPMALQLPDVSKQQSRYPAGCPPAQVWEAACSADSPLLAPGTAARLAPEDAGAAAGAAEVLLTQVRLFLLPLVVNSVT